MSKGPMQRGWGMWALLGIVSVLLWGCATGPKIDWNSRIGNYSYDQAVMEMGPPDRVATLTDGSRVGEWLTARGASHGVVSGFGPTYSHPYLYGPPAYSYTDLPARDRFLRLTFAADGRLLSWQKVVR